MTLNRDTEDNNLLAHKKEYSHNQTIFKREEQHLKKFSAYPSIRAICVKQGHISSSKAVQQTLQ